MVNYYSKFVPIFAKRAAQLYCKVCAAAQSYNGEWYHPTQHSTAPHHWELNYTHYT